MAIKGKKKSKGGKPRAAAPKAVPVIPKAPFLQRRSVQVTAAALVLTSLSWFDGWERVAPVSVIAYGGPVALLAGLVTVRDARRLGRPRHLARPHPDLAREGTTAAG